LWRIRLNYTEVEEKRKNMCLAIPGKIIKIHKNQQATADFGGIEKEINISLVDINLGDYVIVHAGFAIEKVKKANVEDIKAILK
jgi:hydrogenase expression/formation protein HypC